MRLLKPTCRHCGGKHSTIKLYWSTRNLLRKPMKTYYCNKCAGLIVPGAEHIDEGKRP